MTEKKIGTCIKVLVNVGNYQNIEIAKYAESTISYDSNEEMVEKENLQTQELLSSLKRDMAKTPEELGSYEDKVEEFTNSVSKEMPKWLGEGAIPNIANKAKELKEKSDAKQEETKQSKAKAVASVDAMLEESDAPKADVVEVKAEQDDLDSLFGDDEDLFDD